LARQRWRCRRLLSCLYFRRHRVQALLV